MAYNFRLARWTAVAGLGLAFALTPPASAVSSCPMIVDPPGDAIGDPASQGNRPDLDILSVDLKVDHGMVRTLMRVKRLPEGTPLASGGSYYIYVTRDSVDYTIEAVLDGAGQRFTVQTGSPADPLAPYRVVNVTGRFDFTKNQVRVTAPVSALSVDGAAKPTIRFSNIGAETYALYASSLVYAGSSVDDAGGTATYASGRRACF